ncbi:MAG: DUF4386 family protein [Alphaproteobacteria bacterium]|nr:DUF4386 family protein [Alphaproteobacteria bacterium]
MSVRQKLALVGGLYLVAFPFYGGGQYLLLGGQHALGLALVLANTASVIAIGVLLRPLIAQTSPGVAAVTLWGRALEGLILGAGALAFVATAGKGLGDALNDHAYQAAMLVLAVAGAVFARWMLAARVVPAALSAAGLIAYLSLGTGIVLEIVGQQDLSLWFIAGAGIFELVFAVWLIAHGWRDGGRAQV